MNKPEIIVESPHIIVRPMSRKDFKGIANLTVAVYPFSPPWFDHQLKGHLQRYPEGQFVAVDRESGGVMGMCASFRVKWEPDMVRLSWAEITDKGHFDRHHPEGETLYGAEVMVHPKAQGKGIGKLLYRARRRLVESQRLLCIKCGGRPRDYHKHADRLTLEQYTAAIISAELRDRTLNFQRRNGFRFLGVTHGYLPKDAESLGGAVLIEWLNPKVAQTEHYLYEDRMEEKLVEEANMLPPEPDDDLTNAGIPA